jgi:hypothetical protein
MLEEGPKPRIEDEDDVTTAAPTKVEAESPEISDGNDDEFGDKKEEKPVIGGNEPDPACVQKCLIPTSTAPHLPGTASTNTTHDLASSMKIFLVHKEIDKDERTLWTRLTSSSSPSGGGAKKKHKRLTRRPAKKQTGKRRPKTLRQRL